MIDFDKDAPPGLENAVIDSKIPFDTANDVFVQYKGKDVTIHFLMELEDYDKHVKDKHVSFKVDTGGYINIVSDYPKIGLHRLVLGLVNSNAGKYRAEMRFSDQHVGGFGAHLGLFGDKGDRIKGESEASSFRDKVKANQEKILELCKDIEDLNEFKRLVKEEIEKLK